MFWQNKQSVTSKKMKWRIQTSAHPHRVYVLEIAAEWQSDGAAWRCARGLDVHEPWIRSSGLACSSSARWPPQGVRWVDPPIWGYKPMWYPTGVSLVSACASQTLLMVHKQINEKSEKCRMLARENDSWLFRNHVFKLLTLETMSLLGEMLTLETKLADSVK